MLKKALDTTKESIKKLNSTLKSTEKYQNTIQEKIHMSDAITENLRDHLYKIKELEHYLEYFRVVQDIQDIRCAEKFSQRSNRWFSIYFINFSNELASCIHSKDELKIVNHYLALCGDPNSLTSVLGRLQDVNAPNLKLYARQIALYWHEIIREKLSKYKLKIYYIGTFISNL